MRFLARLEEWMLSIVMCVICIITMFNVVSRYLLNMSFSFTEEITTNLFAFAIFMGASLLARENGHLGFSLITDLLPKKIRLIVTGLLMVLTVVFFTILFWYGWEMVMQQKEYGQLSPALGWPEWSFGLAVPIGAILCTIRFTEGYWKEMKRIKGASQVLYQSEFKNDEGMERGIS